MEYGIVLSLLEMVYIPLYAVTLMVALWRYPKYFDTPLRFLPILFLYTFLNELLGHLIASDEYIALIFSDLADNNIIYNVYTIISYLYFFYIFRSFSRDDSFRKNIVYGGLIFLTSCVINVFFQSFTTNSQTWAYVVGACILLYCTVSYLWHFFSIPEKFTLKQNIIFWISLGITLFYLGYLPIKILRFYNPPNLYNESPVVKIMHLSLIFVTYTIFIVGFIRMRRPLRRVINM